MHQVLRTIALIALLALGAGLGTRAEYVAAAEPAGMSVSGQVFIDGKPAPAGTQIKVTYGDTLCATATVFEGKSFITGAPNAQYSVGLPATTSGPCGGPGQWLSLDIGGQNGGAVVEWRAGAHLQQNVIAGTVFDPMYSPFDLVSAVIVDGERLAVEGNVNIRAGDIDCATVKAVPIGNGMTAVENVVVWARSVSNPGGCALMSAQLEFFLDGQKLDVLLGYAISGLFAANGDHFLILGANPGGMILDGKLFVDGEPAPSGTTIEAVVGDAVCGETTLIASNPSLYFYTGAGTFAMSVGGMAESEPDCTEGATMRFRAGDRWANETEKMAASGVASVRLTVGESDFVPIGGEVVSDGAGLPLDSTLTVLKDGVECGRGPVRMNEFGKHLFTDLIAHCSTQDVREMQFFLDRRPLALTYAGEPVPGIVLPAGIRYVTLSDASDAMFLHGGVYVDGQAAHGGSRVDALVGDVVCGQTSVRFYGEENDLFPEEGRYWLAVDSDPRREGCGAEGRQVTFRVDGRPANQVVAWQPGMKQEELRITVGMRDFAVYGGTIVAYRALPPQGTIRAIIGDKECGSSMYSRNMYGTLNFSNLAVPSEADVPGCGRPGAAVEFTMDGLTEGERLEPVDGPMIWKPSAMDQELDLQLKYPGGYETTVDYPPVSGPNTGEGATTLSFEGTRVRLVGFGLLALGSILLLAGSLAATRAKKGDEA